MDVTDLGARLERFLEATWGRPVRVRDVKALTGGYSLLTARFTAETDGETSELVVRFDPPADEALTHTDRAHEWALLDALTRDGRAPMPAARHADTSGEHLGSPAIVLDLVDGPQLLAHTQTCDEEQQRALAIDPARAIGSVHNLGPGIAPPAFEQPASWDAYIDGFIEGWRKLEAGHAERNPFIRWMAQWLDTHRPPPAPLTIVHGEFQTGNVMLDADGNLKIIDWEYAHVGDPRVDLGWAQQVAAFSPPDLIGLDPMAFCAAYCDVTGLGADLVNPLALGWFSMLAGYKALGGLLDGMAAMAAGQNHLLTSAYLVSAMPFTHRMWRQVIAGMEAAMVGAVETLEASS